MLGDNIKLSIDFNILRVRRYYKRSLGTNCEGEIEYLHRRRVYKGEHNSGKITLLATSIFPLQKRRHAMYLKYEINYYYTLQESGSAS